MLSDQTIAPATAADVEHFSRLRFADEASQRAYKHVAETAAGNAFVAKDVDGARLGIAMAGCCDDECFISELFVEPGVRGAGIGSELLRAATHDCGDRSKAAIVPSADASALALCAREGMAAESTVFSLAGAVPREDALLRMAAGDYRFETHPLEARRDAGSLAALDRDVRGVERPFDHAYFGERAAGFGFGLRDEFVGYAYVWPDGRIGPLATASAAYAVQFLSYALVALGRAHGASWCSLLIPGANVRLMRAALRANLRIQETHVFAREGSPSDLSRYAGYQGLLF